MKRVKFMQILERTVYRELKDKARQRGVNIQELIRVEIVPTFLYGPITFDKRTLERWSRIWNGSARKLQGKRRLSSRA